MSVFDPERAARVLLDALLMGDVAAAKKWAITPRTIVNHRNRLETDPSFSSLFITLRKREEGDWRTVRLQFLRKGIAKLEQLVDKADSADSIKDVADALKVIGELQIASDALGVDLGTDQPGQQPPPDAGGSETSAAVH